MEKKKDRRARETRGVYQIEMFCAKNKKHLIPGVLK